MVAPEDIDFYSLGFNFIETKTMFMATHKNGKWDDGKLIPFGNFEISPASCVLNYGQGIFEGMKALRTKNGEITLFRPEENAKRFNFSAKRMLMPEYDSTKFVDAVKKVENENVKYIHCKGKKFNHKIHHAITTIEKENCKEDIIIEEIKKGYYVNDDILRPSHVVVSKK